MSRLILIASLFSSLAGSTIAAEPQASWLKLEIIRGDAAMPLGVVATEVTEADSNLRVMQRIRMGNNTRSIAASSFVEYRTVGDSLAPTAAEFSTDVSGSAKIQSELTFDGAEFTESFIMSRDLKGNDVADKSPVVSKRELKHPEFVHLWALPVLAQRILSAPGRATIALPKFPDQSPLKDNSSVTRDKTLYYDLTRKPADGDGNVTFTLGPVGTDREEWVLVFSAKGTFQSLTMPRRMIVSAASEADFDSWGNTQ